MESVTKRFFTQYIILDKYPRVIDFKEATPNESSEGYSDKDTGAFKINLQVARQFCRML